MEIGNKIREARKAANLTQKQLAEKSGIIETTIRKYEIGKQKPKFENIEKIAAALDLSPSELMPNKRWQGLEEHAKAIVEQFQEEERAFLQYIQMLSYAVSVEPPHEVETEVIETSEDEDGNPIEEIYTVKNEVIYNVSKDGITVGFNKRGFQKFKDDISKAVDFHVWNKNKPKEGDADAEKD